MGMMFIYPCSKPSHLETVNPVVTGICYSKAKTLYDGNSESVLPIMIHGDATLPLVNNYELSNMSQLDGYKAGGSVHIVLNNQIDLLPIIKNDQVFIAPILLK